MNIDKLFKDTKELNKEYKFHLKKNLQKTEKNLELVNAHLDKAKHNLKFFQKNEQDIDFSDWLITILYYSLYQTALALLTNKKFKSKNHSATLIFLIKHYSELEQEIKIIREISIKKEDAILYAKLKKDRHEASYTTLTKFSKEKIKNYKTNVIDFLNKAQELIEQN
jgi:uncharacterized protein (UPF0332 family)